MPKQLRTRAKTSVTVRSEGEALLRALQTAPVARIEVEFENGALIVTNGDDADRVWVSWQEGGGPETMGGWRLTRMKRE